MITIPILFPLVKPFRASWSGKPFYVHPLTADTGENKASVRTENFTEYPIWHKLRKAAGKYSVRKRQRHLTFLPSAVPLHVQNELYQEVPMVFKTFPTRTPREKISPNRLSQRYSQKVHITRHPDHLEDELPENRCRCENLQSEAKWSLAGSLYGNVLEYSACRKSLSAELCLVSQTRSKPDGISFPKGRHFRHCMQYDKSEVVTNICELTV